MINLLDAGEKSVTHGTIMNRSDNIPRDLLSRSIDVESARYKDVCLWFFKIYERYGAHITRSF
jgi:hypothetical protein